MSDFKCYKIIQTNPTKLTFKRNNVYSHGGGVKCYVMVWND